MEVYDKEVFGIIDICNRVELPLAAIKLKDNGEYLYIENGSNIIETGFTSHNINLFLNLL